MDAKPILHYHTNTYNEIYIHSRSLYLTTQYDANMHKRVGRKF